MSMNECDRINGYNALVSANHHETFIAPVKPNTVVNATKEQVAKNQAAKEAEKVVATGYSSSPAINTKLYENAQKQTTSNNTSSSSYCGASGATSYYSNPSYGTGYGAVSQNNQYKGNNLDYNSRLAKIRQKAKETAAQQRKYESSRGAGLIEFDGKYSFSIEKGKVKHHLGKNKTSKLFSKKTVKQAMVAAGVIVLEAALGLVMTEAKSGITGISNEIKKSINNKVK